MKKYLLNAGAIMIAFVVSACGTKEHYTARNALYEAIDIQNMEDIREIVNRSDVDLNPPPIANQVNNPLVYAAMHGNVEIVNFFIDNGADVNARVKFGNTALMKAAEVGNDDIARVLIEKGADVNAANSHGLTVMNLYAKQCNPGMLEHVIANGGDVNAEHDIQISSKYGKRAEKPIETAMVNSNIECVAVIKKNNRQKSQ